jgi:hypothetical protein
MTAVIRVDQAMRYQVGLSRNGVDFRPDGEPFKRPREAVEYARRINGDGEAPRPGQLDLARPFGADRRDAAGQPEAPVPQEASSTSGATSRCAVCGGPLPPGSRRQRRTCSDTCRERARYRRAAGEAEVDVEAQPPDLTVSEPSEALDPDPSSRAGADTLRRQLEATDPTDLSDGPTGVPLSLGL